MLNSSSKLREQGPRKLRVLQAWKINAKEALVLTPNTIIFLVVDVCGQKKSLTLRILHGPSPVAFVLTDPLLF